MITGKIEDGLVLDHIKAGQGMKLYEILGLDKLDCQVALIKHAENGTEYEGKCYISHSACEQDALEVKRLVEQTFPKLEDKVEIYDIGTTIGSHSGPGTVALYFWGDSRLEA